MKTIEEKANRIINTVTADTTYDIWFNLICDALKEHERDTRHACAEAIVTNKSRDTTYLTITKNDAYDVIINTKVE